MSSSTSPAPASSTSSAGSATAPSTSAGPSRPVASTSTSTPASTSTTAAVAGGTPQPISGVASSSSSTPRSTPASAPVGAEATSSSSQTQTPTTATTTATTTAAAGTPASTTSSVSKHTTLESAPTEDVDMAIPSVYHPSAGFVTADSVSSPLKAISPVASATIPNNAGDARLNLPLLGNLAPEAAGTQPFRASVNSSQPFQQLKSSPATPTPVVKPTDVTSASPAPPLTGAESSSATKLAPVVAGMGTLPPNVSAASGSASGSSDNLRAIPTNKNNPAFLNKLRSMVDDPNTDELIRWSPDGASFFVPNHVRFGDEVLPRFFKHNRFSSFVRQLNMYGFHKVPHLQQGALKHDSPQESELWEFSNPHFHRDHPDWLSRVQRKKGPRDEKEGTHGDRETSVSTGQELMHAGALMRTDFGAKALGVDANNSDGALQLASVLNAINAIKNAQTSISADLRHLQNSNQNLWQEAVESRQRAKRQQETINKILRFLAGVFGNQDDPEAPSQGGKKVSGKGGRGGRGRVGVRPQQQRNKSRLMIEDGKSSSSSIRGLEGLELPADEEEIEEMPTHLRFQEASTGNGDSPKSQSPSANNGGSRFTQIGSPPSSTSAANDFSRQLNEAASTPGGSRRLSSQASNQVLNALASGEGNAWLASLFGASLANQGGSKQTGPASSGGGLKLDPQMVAALQQALASAGGTGNGGGADNNNNGDYFNAGLTVDDDFSSRFSTFPSNSSSQKQSSSSSSSRSGSNGNQGLGLDADALSRIAGMSQAIVQSPARQNAGSFNYGLSSPSKQASANLFDGGDEGSNQQLALSLSRATRDLNGTSNDVDQVQNSINSLLEGLGSNPQLLSGIANAPQAAQAQNQGAGAPTSMAWQNAMSAPTDPNSAPFGSGVPPVAPFNTAPQFGSSGVTGATPPSATAAPAPGASGIESDFDVDSFLSQFVDSSQAPGGGVTSPGGGNGYGESPSFAFSPATTAAFLNGAGANDAGNNIFAEVTSGDTSGASSSSNTPPEEGGWNNVGKGKKRKPSTASGAVGMEDVEMASRPMKKSASAGRKGQS